MDLQGKREDLSGPKGKRESDRADEDVLSSFPPYYQAARTHDRTETEIDFPVGLTPPQPSIDLKSMGWGGGVWGYHVLKKLSIQLDG